MCQLFQCTDIGFIQATNLDKIKFTFAFVLGLHYCCLDGEGRLRLDKIKFTFAFVLGLHYLCSLNES